MRSQLVSSVLRASARPTVARTVLPPVLRTRNYSEHAAETFESFTARYVEFFNQAEDIFEVQRGLNNCFAHDLVPAPSVVEAAVRASRRVNDFATAVRVFNGVKVKVENKKQYQEYVEELKGLREELGTFPSALVSSLVVILAVGITLEEELYPEWEK
ncbi:cytochrome-c oxidase chain VI [Mycena metata]|uniref:Cytochrome c oxidase subunit 6, mitochondrial n=1 Tax=Mycena metata TaxID=1033252 RepID=A0AAD7MP15_9AGAR|nr:cytochrome-c oxidase chain VI [Mycena metata]